MILKKIVKSGVLFGLVAFGFGACASDQNVKPNAQLKETYWKLTELMGEKIAPTQNEAHMILKNDGSVNGSFGCNRMMGSYEEKPMERIKFDKMASTMMACVNGMDVEQKFGDVLSRTDSYVIVGDTLQLNRARMAPLAKFEAVYLR